jgi:Fe-S-cluster containining protein
MATVHDILVQYAKLCAWCDSFWNRTAAGLRHHIACGSGCAVCCELPSVNYLESFVIARRIAAAPRPAGGTGAAAPGGPCPFLADNRCSIYAERPVICRTHGLPLKGKSFAPKISISCPYNFTGIDPDSIDSAFVLDIENVSDNLARLNAAFCMLLGDVKKSADRIRMADLANETVGPGWFESMQRSGTHG